MLANSKTQLANNYLIKQKEIFMKTVLKSLLVLGVAAVAYKYRADILGEINHVLPSKGKVKKLADKASKTLSFVRSNKDDADAYKQGYTKMKKSA